LAFARPTPMVVLRLTALVALCLAAAGTVAMADESNVWSRIHTPTPGPSLAIGSAARGCLAGAATLPSDGPGYEAIRLSRNRFFGHPNTVSYVERLGRRAATSGLPAFYVGDMAQPRGGPLPYGHASHQTGIDVDIWFTFAAGPPLGAAARETVSLPSMLLPSWRSVDPKRFGQRQIALLRLAAADPGVDRIFVNPVIKETLCRVLPARDHAWLGRLRPWWEHDDHFHVRLSCPADSPDCTRQAAVPAGDGCDAILASWVRDQRSPRIDQAPPPRRALPVLPAACHAILSLP
jgi:penicillin-insensitive murein DD-endopeptidase